MISLHPLSALPLLLSIFGFSIPVTTTHLVGEDLIGDSMFKAGLTLMEPAPGKQVPYGTLLGFSAGASPLWKLAQWNSQFPLDPTTAIRRENQVICENRAKSVVIDGETSTLLLAANSGAEYGAKAREKSDPWIHLLAEQRFWNAPFLSELKSLRFHVEAKLVRCTNLHQGDYDPRRHAAQFQIFFTLQNRNRQSIGYGDYLWFGVPLYDNRSAFSKQHKAREFLGAGKYIYTLGGEKFLDHSLHEGTWGRVDRDLRPLMIEALTEAWAGGYLSDSKDIADYALGGMNMGWELPGTFDAAMEVRALSMQAERLAP